MRRTGYQLAELVKRIYRLFKIKPDFNYPIAEVPVNLPKNRFLALIRSFFPYKTIVKTSERIVENPFLFINLNLPKNSRILEVGCCRSMIAIELAGLGYKITACDLKYYKYTHPNLTFIQGDLRYLNLPEEYFDGATSISTIEHVGIGAYKDKLSKNGDKQMIQKIYRLLKHKGKLIITVPFGKKEVNSYERVYDYKSLLSLLRNFKIQNIEFYEGLNREYWIPVDKKELEDVSSVQKDFVQGIACIVAQKE